MELRDESPPQQAAEGSWLERETLVEASPDEVREALTDEDRLEEWLAPEVELDPFEGGEIAVRDGDEERNGTVETFEENERFAFYLVPARGARELRRDGSATTSTAKASNSASTRTPVMTPATGAACSYGHFQADADQ